MTGTPSASREPAAGGPKPPPVPKAPKEPKSPKENVRRGTAKVK
jgi:hypothetical protein